ncbi:MAG: RidA family protein [Isosphaeraceae bacterium]
MDTVEHPLGNYRFLPGIAPYSRGVVAAPGFEIVRASLQRPLPWRLGFDRIANRLASESRPKAALCSVELRSPKPFTFDGFARFNADYATILHDWGVFVEGINPVARTNVAPEFHAPEEPSLFAFSYTRPVTERDQDPVASTFVVAGAGELPEGVLSADAIVAPGNLTVDGLAEKVGFVIGLMEERLRGLGARWEDVTTVDAYTVNPFFRALTEVLIPRLGPATRQGLCWYFSRPPIVGIEFEMDLRGVRREYRL